MQKKNHTGRLCTGILIITIAALMGGCTPRIQLSVSNQGEISASVDTSMGSVIENTVRSVSAPSGGASFFDLKAITQSLTQAGLSSVNAESTTGSDLHIRADFNANAAGSSLVSKFVSLRSQTDGSRELVLSLSPETVKELFKNLPEDTASYADLLMAPVFTGEEMSSEEYVDLVGAVYGQPVANELKRASLSLHITVSNSIKTARTDFGSASVSSQGREADFSIPLADFLSNTKPVSFYILY